MLGLCSWKSGTKAVQGLRDRDTAPGIPRTLRAELGKARSPPVKHSLLGPNFKESAAAEELGLQAAPFKTCSGHCDAVKLLHVDHPSSAPLLRSTETAGLALAGGGQCVGLLGLLSERRL